MKIPYAASEAMRAILALIKGVGADLAKFSKTATDAIASAATTAKASGVTFNDGQTLQAKYDAGGDPGPSAGVNLLSKALMGEDAERIDDERSMSKYGYSSKAGDKLWNNSIITFSSKHLPFVHPGEKYTLSALMWTTGEDVQVYMDFFPDTLPQSGDFTVTATPQRFSFTASSDLEEMENAYYRFVLTYQNGEVTQSNRVFITDIKLERGDTATDWSPAPDDKQDTLTGAVGQVVGFDAKGNAVAATVGGVNLFSLSDASNGWLKDDGVTLSPGDKPTYETTSDYIPVTPGEQLTVQYWGTPVENEYWTYYIHPFFYDAQKSTLLPTPQVIGGKDFSSWAYMHVSKQIAVPENAAYMRVSARMYYDGKIKFERGAVATDWSPAPGDIQVGGRNLLTGTNRGVNNWTFGALDGAGTTKEVVLNGSRAVRVDVTTPSTGWIYVHFTNDSLKERLEPNREYTISFDAVSNADIDSIINLANRNSNFGRLASTASYHLRGDEKVHRVVARTRANDPMDDDTDNTNGVQIGLPPNNTLYMIIGNLKLERGAVATDWTPAPEDILPEWGTAKAAEKLAEARSINGVAFDGTGDIDIANLRETRVVDTDFQTYVSDFISNNRNRVDGVDAYRFFVNEPGDPGQYHLPVADSHIFVFGNTVNYTRALAMDVRTRDVYVCGCISGVWRDWVKVLDSTGKAASSGTADKVAHSLTFTGAVSGTFDGSGDVKINVPTIAGAKGDKGDTGPAGPAGPKGDKGDTGPNAVSTSTTSDINGLLKGSGGKVAPAVAGTDYVTPSGLTTAIQQAIQSTWEASY